MIEVLFLKDPDGDGVLAAGMLGQMDAESALRLEAEGALTTDPELLRKAKESSLLLPEPKFT